MRWLNDKELQRELIEGRLGKVLREDISQVTLIQDIRQLNASVLNQLVSGFYAFS